MVRKVDHIVYAVQDLDSAIATFEKKLGVRPIFGGFHTTFGTKNALVSLDKGCYLELLAADDTNTNVSKPRWMGVDVLEKDQITRWALKSNQLETDRTILKNANPEMGAIRSGSRNVAGGGVLQWDLIMPLPHPEVELLPFMVDWAKSDLHPTDTLPDMGCKLIKIYGTYPSPEKLAPIFEQLRIDFTFEKAPEIQLNALIECPMGRIHI